MLKDEYRLTPKIPSVFRNLNEINDSEDEDESVEKKNGQLSTHQINESRLVTKVKLIKCLNSKI